MNNSAHPKSTANTVGSTVLDALIIGAGFSGLYQLHCLRDKLGLDVRVVEAGEGVGGTWYWNRYPGARCDSESHSYCYTFSEELTREWRWSERYPGPAEIRRYLSHVAERFDLNRNISFNSRVTSAHYQADQNLWRTTLESGETVLSRYLITAVGCLSTANIPNIPGLDSFNGDWHHTGRWPHEGVDFTGKRVGQVGTGSTGIQAAPVIAETAAHLTVFQRTANYSVPAHNGPLSEEFQQWVQANLPQITEIVRTTSNGHPFRISEKRALETDAEERTALYEAAWAKGGLRFRATFEDLLADEAANETAAEFIKNKIRGIVKDPETARLLTDIDHPYAAKRPPIDTHYFEAFNLEHVDLVDIRSSPIVQITPTGIRTENAEYPLDIIVFATGFDAMTGPLLGLDIRGRDGLTLADAWSAGPRNYLGLQVAGFPNLFTITGPGSPSVLCNMPIAIEQHVDWITDCIDYMRDNKVTRIEATDDAMTQWVEQVNAAANATLLPKAKHSWYLGANVPGKPRVFMPYVGGMDTYRKICAQVAANQYPGFSFS